MRRLIVAMSRARLGLYIFGRIGLFQNCFELGPALRLLTCRPNNLMVAPDETYPAERPFGKAPRTQVNDKLYFLHNKDNFVVDIKQIFIVRLI